MSSDTSNTSNSGNTGNSGDDSDRDDRDMDYRVVKRRGGEYAVEKLIDLGLGAGRIVVDTEMYPTHWQANKRLLSLRGVVIKTIEMVWDKKIRVSAWWDGELSETDGMSK